MKQQFTKAAIEKAFIQLLEEKPFEKVTVKDIVDCCGLTRNTFYYYFEDTYDIVDEILTNQIERQLSEINSEVTSHDVMRACVSFAIENQRLVSHLFNSPKRDELKIYFAKAEKIAAGRYVDTLVSEKKIGEEDKNLICDYCRYFVNGILEDWLSTGMKYDLEEKIKRASFLFGNGIREAVLRASE